MSKFMRAALAAWLVTFAAWPALATPTSWSRSATFAAGQDFSGSLTLTGNGTAFWGPRSGSDPSPLLIVPTTGVRAKLVWDADATSTGGSVSLSLQAASGTGSTSTEWEELDVIPAATSCADPATTCSQKRSLDPGIYRFVPSGTAANGRLRLDWY